ncbi:chitin-binding domain-containing protein [Ruegeria arenilitoris]|uniref:chitin-binding domain-containing protein n=1 Tax=Ruegeria arenilitoris TaxID=1173585 RepID=UPI00147EB1D2|nr:chitin-binding domain-containing protein [Ruegeria arenilitoris]
MIRTLICALALGSSASVALACSGHSKQTQSCALGTYWDAETQTCAKIVNS